MRIVKSEKIYLSQNEWDAWIGLDHILSGLAIETENPNTKKMILKVQDLLNDLWEEMDMDIEVE